jgi:hypothetical protein
MSSSFPFAALHTARRIAALAVLSTLAACGEDSVFDPAPSGPRGIVVLDGFVQPGLTLLADTGTASTKVSFGPPTEFDAGGFTMERDTVLAVSSRGAGDLLYITDVRTGSVRRVQMPARSNPGKARLLRGANGATLIGVALRDSGSIALVSITGGATPVITRLANAGLCPSDVFQFDNAMWVVDANSNCRSNYAVQGDARLIRIPDTGTARDTMTLAGARSSGVGALVVGNIAYISAGGDADFGAFPYTLRISGTITKVDLRARRVLMQRGMPVGSYGASTKLGKDGFLYVSLYENLSAFASRTLKLRADDLTSAGAGSPYLTLTDAAGANVPCTSAVADVLGRVHCLVRGAASATSLVVFSPAGVEIRRVPAGQGGVDLALR